MKTVKNIHPFYPSGQGIAIIWNDELTLFYKIGDQFTVWSTAEVAPKDADELRLFMDVAHTISNVASRGASQIGSLSDILEDMPDQVLGGIYEAVVGYNPFSEDPNARALICDYLSLPEAQLEIF